MNEDNLPQVKDNTSINDARLPNDFSGISFSNYKKVHVRNKLIENMLNNKIEPACYWCCELICAGHFMDIWENIIHYVGKHIHIGNPKIIIYLKKRFILFQSIINDSQITYPHQLRNHPTIRQLFAEIIATLTLSNRKHSFEPIKIKREEEFDMTKLSDRLHAPSVTYITNILRKDDPKELFIAINEFSYNISEDNKHTINACYWVEWIIEFSLICKKRKEPCECSPRRDIPVEIKYQTNIIWILWDALFYHCEKLNNSYIQALLESLLVLFCIKYSAGTNKKRRYLLYFGVALLTETIPNDIKLMNDKDTITHVSNNINLIYKQIKKNEIKPTSDYLFANLEKESRLNASLEKMNLVNSIDILKK